MEPSLSHVIADGAGRHRLSRSPGRTRRGVVLAGLSAVLAAALTAVLPVSGLHGAATALGATCPGGSTQKTTSGGDVCEARVTSTGTWAAPPGVDEIDIVVVGGGGGGGGASMGNFGESFAGAGGGGGEVIFRTGEAVTEGEVLTVTIGTGGTGGSGATHPTAGGNGSDGVTTTVTSSSLGTLSADGGTGGDGGSATLPPAQVGGDSARDVNGTQTATSGGDSFKHTADLGTAVQGGGGAGANADGSDGTGTTGAKGSGGAGGAGYLPATGRFDQNATSFAGGGGGGGARFFSPGGAGGAGGGGNGGSTQQDISLYRGQNGTASSGGGGGGASHGGQPGEGGPGGNGGSGVVVIRFDAPKADQSALTLTSTSGTLGTPLTLTTSGGDGNGAVTYVVDSGPCTVDANGVLTATGAGDCYVTATKAGDSAYKPVSSTSTKVTFAKKTQSALTLTTSAGTVGTPVTLATSGGSSTGAVTYVVDSGPCTVIGGILLTTGAGDCYVTATKAGDSEYDPVSSSSSKVTISRGTPPALSVSTTEGTYGTPLTLGTNGGAGTGAVTWVVDSGPCTISGGVLRATGAGDCYVTATKAADSSWDAVSSSSTKVEIAKADPVCTVVGYSVTYDGNEHTAAGTCVGVPGDGALAGLDLSATAHTDADVYTGDAWTFTDTSGNYENESGTVDNRIRRAIPVCEIEAYLVTYDGTEHTATGTCKGVDDLALTGLDLSGTAHTAAGTYPTDPWSFTDTTGNYRDRSGTVRNVIAKADQDPLTIDQTTGTTGVPLPLSTSGGSGSGAVTWRAIAGGCTVDGSSRLRAVAPGACLIEATKAADANHRVASVVGTVTFIGDGISSIAVELISDETEFGQVPGQTLTFRYRVTNDGGVPFPGPVVVDDPAADVTCPDLTTIGNQDGVLDPGETLECVGTHVVDAADIAAGAIDREVGVSVGDADVSAGTESPFRIRVAPTFFVLLDRSASQGPSARRTVDGYNRLIDQWQAMSRLGRFSLVLFSTDGIERRYENREIRNVPKMSIRSLAASGGTPLWDVTAQQIRALRARGPIGRVYFAIASDGIDTASTKETKASVAKLIRTVERTLGWRFVYTEATIAASRVGPAAAEVPAVR